MSIKEMQSRDIDEIVELEKTLFSSPWSSDDFSYELTTNPFSKIFILEKDNSIIGYIGMWLLGDQSQITTLGVSPLFQGCGYAKALLEKALQVSEEHGYLHCTLEVRQSNKKAIGLYEKYGFVKVATRKNYYSDPDEDAYLMMKELEV